MAYSVSANQPSLDLAAQYEPVWTIEGGHHLAFVNGGYQLGMVMFGFNDPHSFAMTVQTPDVTVVVRADGYPDLAEVVPALGMLYRGLAPRMAPETAVATAIAASAQMTTPKVTVRSSLGKPKIGPAK